MLRLECQITMRLVESGYVDYAPVETSSAYEARFPSRKVTFLESILVGGEVSESRASFASRTLVAMS